MLQPPSSPKMGVLFFNFRVFKKNIDVEQKQNIGKEKNKDKERELKWNKKRGNQQIEKGLMNKTFGN